MGINKLSLTDEIIQHVQSLPDTLKVEVLDFTRYLELKNKKSGEDVDWSAFSLSSAMRGMEDEPSPYTIEDLQERF